MINCAHPTRFASALKGSGEWTRRIGGLWANASRCSHAELDVMEELDAGNPAELGRLYARLREGFLGGCCGTDIRHVTAIAEAVVGKAARVSEIAA